MKRGIYLVGNLRSQEMCQNLIYSIRESGCNLPIRLIHFGGKEINSSYILNQVELLKYENFPANAKQFIANLRTVLTDCPMGYLYRYLAWFSDWDEFIYSDNDIVALCNWDKLFDYLSDNDLVHADEEYTTEGKFNYDKPESIKSIFGATSLQTAITAGHIVVKKNSRMVEDINKAVKWFKENPEIPKKHDQSLMHIASLLGNWKMLNLCRTHGWLSSWAGDYKNSLEIIHKIQNQNSKISHIHYSGGSPNGAYAIHELLFSNNTNKDRLRKLFLVGTKVLSGYSQFRKQYSRVKNFASRRLIK